jgi:hypothetical protein
LAGCTWTDTSSVTRTGQKMNVTGSLDDLSWEGSELALFIRDADGIERLFMEDHLSQENVRQPQASKAPLWSDDIVREGGG